MSILHTIDNDEISVAIDIDQGARIASLIYRGYECVVPFRGQLLTWGWYAMAPWVRNSCSRVWSRAVVASIGI